jgi:hypothetical protein
VGEHSQLDLRVVGGEQARASRRHEAGADLAAGVGADRDVLEVGVDAREPPGRGRGLAEGRVQAPVARVDQLGQGVEVGRLELGQLPPRLDLGHDLVLAADGLENARIGREAGLATALAGEAESLE